MEQNQNKTQSISWDNVEKQLATEIIQGGRRESKAKDFAIVCMAIASAVIALGMALINYKNDEHWREMFGEYDFITQDGEGYNYYNSDIGGNVTNGATSSEEAE